MIQEFTLFDHSWDDIVASFEKYDVYQLSGYSKGFSNRNEGIPRLLYYTKDGIRGMNVVMKRDIAEAPQFSELLSRNSLFDLTTPYGYGGWLFEGEGEVSADSFSREYEEWCRENRIVSEFVRFHPVQNNVIGINEVVYDPAFLGNTVAIGLDTPEQIWERLSPKNRGHIRKAMKSGVEVKISADRDSYMEFMKIYESTMRRDEASDYYYFDSTFYDSIRNDLEGNALLFTAYLGRLPIAASIMLFANRYMNYHLSGQLFEYRKFSGTSLILYEAAKWGCRHGYKTLHLGGGVGAQRGSLYDYKKSFNAKGNDYNFYVGKKIHMPKKYDALCSIRGIEKTGTEGYFPSYRK